jgi:hypothetical protein
MEKQNLDFGGIQGSPKFQALVPCRLATRLASGFGIARSAKLAALQAHKQGLIQQLFPSPAKAVA